jgi:hypothetical protein
MWCDATPVFSLSIAVPTIHGCAMLYLRLRYISASQSALKLGIGGIILGVSAALNRANDSRGLARSTLRSLRST